MKLKPVTKKGDAKKAPARKRKSRKRKTRNEQINERVEKWRNTPIVTADESSHGVFPEGVDMRYVERMLCPWHELDMQALRKVFDSDDPMVALYERDPVAVAWLGLCYDPFSPFVLSYSEVGDRKDAVSAALKIPEAQRETIHMIADIDIARAMVSLLMRLHRTKWTMLVAYQEMLYRTVAMTTWISPEELATMKMRGKGIADWLMSSMKALKEAKSMTQDIEELMLEVTRGDSVAAKRVEQVADYSAEFMANVLNTFMDSQTSEDEEE